jgi:hypothetical protein
MIKNPTILKDALHNVCVESGASDDYSRGLVVGVVSALMAVTGWSFSDVSLIVANCLPYPFDPNRVPSVFRDTFVGDNDNG